MYRIVVAEVWENEDLNIDVRAYERNTVEEAKSFAEGIVEGSAFSVGEASRIGAVVIGKGEKMSIEKFIETNDLKEEWDDVGNALQEDLDKLKSCLDFNQN